ncbi:uncharacterized protein LOC142574594, partial [Dermacentor variabilis]|uniref:uncharacterized protein LOC142574594 n=1 Tax=Dermacentor variabilis TaxID=34621 RepID=UPI003F5C6555
KSSTTNHGDLGHRFPPAGGGSVDVRVRARPGRVPPRVPQETDSHRLPESRILVQGSRQRRERGRAHPHSEDPQRLPEPGRAGPTTGISGGNRHAGAVVGRRDGRRGAVPQAPVPKAPVPQDPVPQDPVPQDPVPQHPVAQAQCTPELRRTRPTHTLCKPPNPGCKIHYKGVSAADRSLILNLHNSYRSQVAQGRLQGFATAADMYRLRWDDEMANVAQALSNQCTEPGVVVDHDDPLDRSTSRFNLTGQNLAKVVRRWPPPRQNWTFIIDSWFNEYQYYSPGDVRAYNPYTARHTNYFTQIIWAKTHHVGCGYVNFSFADPSATPPYMEIYACNYGPAGNLVSVRTKLPIYEEGPTCSACPAKARCHQDTGLCGGAGRGPRPPPPPDPPAGNVPDPQSKPNPVTTRPGGGGGGGGGATGGQSGDSPESSSSSGSSAEEDKPSIWLPLIAGLVVVTVALTCCLYFAFAQKKRDQPQEQAAPAGMESQLSTSSTAAL